MDEIVLKNSFVNFLEGKGLELQGLSLQHFPLLFAAYFETVKFDGFSNGNDGDNILFQYGDYDWGNGKFFQINFTRQLYEIFFDESHQILQLRVTFYYDSAKFITIEPFNVWSSSCKNIKEFQDTISISEAFNLALDETLIKIEMIVDTV
jgi:hypothetical protein